ncbi:FKBP-type peptidyl-prolyl cis-trans isomerase [Vibrio sp. VB16]|uniref:FKBP-type peptidyl-prolyl cis-trans isomerase n=1 Tax=Vibrio sp. VB16 TaxID=2785746 RepID=UPI00189D4C12|nr:FKBP-type peptidyl-prolyl cis-trans isomerase [Vibrio sp. VB16]UGA54577.1 FKBP-type peptidyl-prolyl cis-trans isomerase [Vibrio sp. VB16]
MKPLFKVSLLAATVMLAVGCQKEETPKVEAAPVVEQAQAEAEKAVHFKTEEDKAAYAFGLYFAKNIESSIDGSTEIGIELKKELVLQGIEDVFADTEKMTDDELRLALESFEKTVSEKMQAKAAADAEAAMKASEEFRAEFEKQEGVMKTESGLLYQVMTPAEGDKPAETDTVEVHYVGTLIDGTKFDSSYDRDATATFPLNRVIPGWTEGVQLMSVGSKYKFVIPPELAYGPQDTPTIPGNSTLVFEVELISIDNGEVEEAPAETPAAE